MAKKQIRTKYIKSLMEDKASLASSLEESTKETLSSLLDEKVNRSLRQMLAESDDDDSYEEEVDPTETEFDTEDTENNDTDTVDVDLESGESDDPCADGSCDTEGDEVWDEVADCQDADGDYDLRGKDINTVLRVLNAMEPDEDVRIIKKDDNTAEVIPSSEDESEFIIDINDSGEAEPNKFEDDGFEGTDDDFETADIDFGGDDLEDTENDDIDDEGETEFELSIDDGDNDEENAEDMMNEGEVNLGYTDNYQRKTAMTMPNDKGDGEGDSRFDAGAPKGGSNNGKRWVGTKGANGGNPYTQKTKQPMTEEYDECGDTIFEVEMGDDMGDDMPVDETHTRGMARKHNSVGRTEVPDTNVQADEEDTRNIYVGAKQVRNTSRATNEAHLRAIDSQMNTILSENAQLRSIMAQFKEKLDEAVVINSCLAKATKLFTENSTTREEKINILNRFNKVRSINESKALYNQISGELKNAHSVNNNLLNNQLTEAKGTNKNMIVETNMLGASEELRRILDLQDRMANK